MEIMHVIQVLFLIFIKMIFIDQGKKIQILKIIDEIKEELCYGMLGE